MQKTCCVLPNLKSFTICVHDGLDAHAEHLQTMAKSAMNDQTIKYSTFSLQQIQDAFQQATSVIGIYIADRVIPLPAGFATIQKNAITSIFTLPAGKGNMIVGRLLTYVMDYLPEIEYVHTYNFDWIKGPCISRGFTFDKTIAQIPKKQVYLPPTNELPMIEECKLKYIDLTLHRKEYEEILVNEIDWSQTDYKMETIQAALLTSSHLLLVVDNIGQHLGFALYTMTQNQMQIQIVFTLPRGKGQNLIPRLICILKESYTHISNLDKVTCNTQAFPWFEGACRANQFYGDITFECNVLHFNYKKVQELEKLDTEKVDILQETTFEHSPLEGPGVAKFGPLCQQFINLISKRVSKEELKYARLDVRASIIRAGQNMNPFGIHADFVPKDKNGFYSQPKKEDKVFLVSIGAPSTKIYTKPFGIAISSSDWTYIWRHDLFQKNLTDYIVTKDGIPIEMNSMTLHTAQLYEGKEAIARLVMRIILFDSSRSDMVPTQFASSLPQVYMMGPNM